ncbi:MAG: SGNH/GDSL hydrolase family protein [Thermodesulfovibrionia bacterium]|nr:SGNH/GDSL hydrolase family protein [Thermodesulfovibrionia bacterium]
MYIKSKNVKNILANLSLSVVVIIISLLALEFITRTFWNAGYRHPYDWRSRIEGYEQSKDEGTFRILLLGDSNAYGQGVSREETFAKLVEKSLNANNITNKNRKYEVINLAWPGLNSADEYMEYRYKGVKYNPDLVLVAFSLNDLGGPSDTRLDVRSPIYTRSSKNRRGKKGWEYSLPISYKLDRFLSNHSDFYLFLLRRYDSLLQKAGLRKREHNKLSLIDAYEDKNKNWNMTQIFLSKIYDLSKKLKIKSSLVILPQFYDVRDYHFEVLHNKIERTAKKKGYYVLDLLPHFKGKKSEEFIVSGVDTHPNALAHSMMAENIYNFLVENKLIKKENVINAQHNVVAGR